VAIDSIRPEPASSGPERRKLLILIVAYYAESTISNVLSRIPRSIAEDYETEILVLDDGSADHTFERARQIDDNAQFPFALTVLRNPTNQGYGGNQKIGYFYALRNGFDFVALLHGDGQYAPECLPELVRRLEWGDADACFGSRMMTKGGALKGGMPLIKFVGNKVLTWFQNRTLQTTFTEFHSGYRIYSTAALRRIPFALNTNDFHFDTEIIIQFTIARLRIVELPIPTYYGKELSRVAGLKYAWNVVGAMLRATAQEFGLFYDRRFDCAPANQKNAHYQPKLEYESPHTLTLQVVRARSRVLDYGCAGGYVAAALKARNGCTVVGIDRHPLAPGIVLDGFQLHDLDRGLPDVPIDSFDYILLLDVIEHMTSPELFVEALREALKTVPDAKIIVSTANIGFAVTRLMLLFGQFNYGPRGILDMTHTRLFTFASLRRLFEQNGFRVLAIQGVPGPYPLALGHNWFSRFLIRLNSILIRISKRLFSYQIFMLVQPYPSLDLLLEAAKRHSKLAVLSGPTETADSATTQSFAYIDRAGEVRAVR
jgi:glycosyltransferase involved in cell wall biosynthesis/2-polyprenyl-3-methyl-5-hydroxy-6-metoxy-1,4-benzoquinol methylase